MICPACGHHNIDGNDWCDTCSESLTAVPPRRPAKALMERRIESTPLSTLNPAIPVCVGPSAPVGWVLELLAARNIGCVLIIENRTLLGIFSERDALMKIGTELGELAGQPVSRFMTASPNTLGPGDSIAFAINHMAVGGFRHIPITESDQPVGIISIRDVLRYVTQQFPEILAESTISSEKD